MVPIVRPNFQIKLSLSILRIHFIERIPQLLMIEILPDKCDFCGCCVGICPEDAIELKEAEINIVEELCTNCSKCIWACPIEVFKFNRNGVGKVNSEEIV
ncbi:MAG: 4Fe-4S binding protein [Melioribacteraceae bacterium]|nr:4Fe-4S binding protein [Melioribacteraceae bacterium]MCF8263295.1 4Fe-4S binding protein [Melioribacteraceae bacterium]MCF8413986.1 4Fe-4S binding protein [Melioribacteraceae bacterium]MCF8431994.1 4Fe-4S binding protein [Melioribacteraceae bacterium]